MVLRSMVNDINPLLYLLKRTRVTAILMRAFHVAIYHGELRHFAPENRSQAKNRLPEP